MTRINVVPPEVLSDKHLMAEYRELPRVFTAVKKMKNVSYTWDAPKKYCLGAGHVKFFYTRCQYLHKRYALIAIELVRRGFNIDAKLFGSVLESYKDLPDWSKGDYKPDQEAVYLNMARLVKRCKFTAALDEMRSDA